MNITVKLFASLRTGRFTAEKRSYPDDAITVARIVEELEIPPHELGIILVNGQMVTPERHLAENDTLSIFPQIGGG